MVQNELVKTLSKLLSNPAAFFNNGAAPPAVPPQDNSATAAVTSGPTNTTSTVSNPQHRSLSVNIPPGKTPALPAPSTPPARPSVTSKTALPHSPAMSRSPGSDPSGGSRPQSGPKRIVSFAEPRKLNTTGDHEAAESEYDEERCSDGFQQSKDGGPTIKRDSVISQDSDTVSVPQDQRDELFAQLRSKG